MYGHVLLFGSQYSHVWTLPSPVSESSGRMEKSANSLVKVFEVLTIGSTYIVVSAGWECVEVCCNLCPELFEAWSPSTSTSWKKAAFHMLFNWPPSIWQLPHYYPLFCDLAKIACWPESVGMGAEGGPKFHHSNSGIPWSRPFILPCQRLGRISNNLHSFWLLWASSSPLLCALDSFGYLQAESS